MNPNKIDINEIKDFLPRQKRSMQKSFAICGKVVFLRSPNKTLKGEYEKY